MGLSLSVYLGWGEVERSHPQPICCDIRLRFRTPPQACQSDQLEDTYCYARCVKRAQQAAEAPARLIEALAQRILEAVDAEFGGSGFTAVRLTKLHPPHLQALVGGAVVLLSNWPDEIRPFG